MTPPISFDNTYVRLPEHFYTRTKPVPMQGPQMIRVNRALAYELNIDTSWLDTRDALLVFSGNHLPDGAEPVAMAYAGHQFGVFVPQLGDGRAILLGEVIDRAGTHRDIHFKGSGRTPFSRGGDGRAALGPVLREYIVSEAMAALGVPTTRTLAAVVTGEEVVRERLLPGAVLTRVAASHVRVGTFQYFASRGDIDAVRTLADYVIARHYPEAAESEQPYRALLDAVIRAQALLVARWLLIGFVHGVMNTDNTAVSGETIDYGPCAFLDHYDPKAVWSSIDRYGRYAYMNQPIIAEWNLARFGECLLPLISEDPQTAVLSANESLDGFAPQFESAYHAGLRRKIGLLADDPQNTALTLALLEIMAENRADFTLTFRALANAAADRAGDTEVRGLFIDPPAYDRWAERWRERLETQPGDPEARRDELRRVNPAYIPRNHRVEEAIRAAEDRGDFTPFEKLLDVLSKPYDDQPETIAWAHPPQEHERVLATFCGT